MECKLVVPHGTAIGDIEKEYPDIYVDEYSTDGDVYSVGDDCFDYDEAIAFCGFAEGAVDGAEAVIDGNGVWAMSELRCVDFSGKNEDASAIAERKRRSVIWHEAFERGKGVR